ncbi:MAG: Rho-binding antiterminator [Gammaproteobacteria bacterium]|nr:Rho-binding antiterminator [Gammaproteobacteria bacterium]
MSESVISCHIHDYIEIACMYGYQVRLELTNHDRIEGKPVTTKSKSKQEFLVMQTAAGQQDIELSNIRIMRALTSNPHFDRIDF